MSRYHLPGSEDPGYERHESAHSSRQRSDGDNGANTYPCAFGAGLQTADRLTLVGATALVVGSIIGVGIFNLPTSLASYGPISSSRWG